MSADPQPPAPPPAARPPGAPPAPHPDDLLALADAILSAPGSVHVPADLVGRLQAGRASWTSLAGRDGAPGEPPGSGSLP